MLILGTYIWHNAKARRDSRPISQSSIKLLGMLCLGDCQWWGDFLVSWGDFIFRVVPCSGVTSCQKGCERSSTRTHSHNSMQRIRSSKPETTTPAFDKQTSLSHRHKLNSEAHYEHINSHANYHTKRTELRTS